MKPRLVPTISPDWFDDIVSAYTAAARHREQIEREGEAKFIREAVEFWREHTNSKQVYDRCTIWLGRRS